MNQTSRRRIKPPADSVRTLQITRRERLVHQHDARRLRVALRVEESPLAQLDADRREITRRGDAPFRVRFFALFEGGWPTI
jgi:hypothetical protein